MLQLPLKFLLQPQLLLPARLRGVDDVLLAAATLGAHARGLLDAGVAQDVVGALDALLAAAGALGRLGQRFILAVPVSGNVSVGYEQLIDSCFKKLCNAICCLRSSHA